MHLRLDLHTMLVYNLQKTKTETQKLKETGVSLQYIIQYKLDKTCFQLNTSYGDFKDLLRRTASDKVLRDKPFKFAKNPKYDGYHHELA